uniref:Uncharacterized protein n=1 Tax=Triticum urartu TaxID=4572 RepID=A0A8R7VBV6_TRIUA
MLILLHCDAYTSMAAVKGSAYLSMSAMKEGVYHNITSCMRHSGSRHHSNPGRVHKIHTGCNNSCCCMVHH